jgi:SAM-dependent methyltransferase
MRLLRNRVTRTGQENGIEVTRASSVAAYEAHTDRMLREHIDEERALGLVVGSNSPEEFAAVGEMQHRLLVAHGLEPQSSLVEIGCGAGRLAAQLAGWQTGPYLGLDVVRTLLDHAESIAKGPNMRYQRVNGLSIPADTESVDMVCAFSVFTHLRHEESYTYLMDCARVLKTGGSLIFSFLEFRVPSHWLVMEASLDRLGHAEVPNQFMGVDAVEAWAHHLNLEVVEVFRGDEPFIPLLRPISLHGQQFLDFGTFGQSVAVLRKLEQPSRGA